MKNKLTISLLACFCLTCPFTFGQGHYLGSSFNPGDYFAPPPGFIVPVYYSYSSMNYFNNSGDKSETLIKPGTDDPTSLSIQQHVNTNSFIAMVIYGGRKKIAGANWGMMAIPMLSSPAANIALDYYSTNTGEGNHIFKSNSFGLADLYVQPVWLTWMYKKWTYSFTYGLWVPVGKYKAGDSKNIGLGYFSHDLRAAARFKPSMPWAISLSTTFELNNKQKDVDYTEAAHVTIDFGGSYTFTMGHEIGAYAHYMKQIGHDKGSAGSLLSDRTFGVGAYGSYWFIPGKFGILGRVVQHFGTRNRFAGTTATIGLNFLFLDKPKN